MPCVSTSEPLNLEDSWINKKPDYEPLLTRDSEDRSIIAREAEAIANKEDTALEQELDEHTISDEEIHTTKKMEVEEETPAIKEQTYKECIVIVGAFSRQSNVERMKSRLMELGFDIHVSELNNMTRVGASFNSNEKNVLETLRFLRKEVEPGSWILNN